MRAHRVAPVLAMAVVLSVSALSRSEAQQVPRDTARRDSAAVRPDSAAAPADSAAQRPAARRPQVRGDSVRPRSPISPGQAFLRSLVLPGWGQASLRRNVTGGIFVAFEGVAMTMVWKAKWQLDYARARGVFVHSHTQELQDWTVLLVFNHFMSATEAFVSAHLYDFPVGLKMQRFPDGETGVGMQLRF